jgi:dihydroflavonol-4-reductase
MKTVGIIGGAGFIGSYVTKLFLENNCKVRVSTTDITNKSKYRHLFYFENASNLEIVPLNLTHPETVKTFVDDCTIIVHCGSPFKLDVQNPQNELFDPTVRGTEIFLNIIKSSIDIEKVVFVASVAAWNTSFPLPPATYANDHFFSERDTPYFSENDHPYGQAKFMADQVVRKFIADNEDIIFEIVSVSPVLVVGNQLSAREDSTSIGFQHLFKHKIIPNPFVEYLFTVDIPFALVDVRNVAEAIYKAATLKSLHGKNYLLSSETYKISDISLMLNKKPPSSSPTIYYDNSLAKNELGLSFLPAKETLHNCD